jgi:hypothetical protein
MLKCHIHRRASEMLQCNRKHILSSNPSHCLDEDLMFYKIMKYLIKYASSSCRCIPPPESLFFVLLTLPIMSKSNVRSPFSQSCHRIETLQTIHIILQQQQSFYTSNFNARHWTPSLASYISISLPKLFVFKVATSKVVFLPEFCVYFQLHTHKS